MNNKGFTLIELMIVFAILGIIAATLTGYVNKSRYDESFDVVKANEFCQMNSIQPLRTTCYMDDNNDTICIVVSNTEKIYLNCKNETCYEIMPD